MLLLAVKFAPVQGLRTADDKLIVEDKFLNFLVIKVRTLSQDEM